MTYTDKPKEPPLVQENASLTSATKQLKAAHSEDFDDDADGDYDVSYVESLPEDVRIELINGKLYDMSSSSRTHQAILRELLLTISNYIRSKNGKCQVYPAPFAVYLIEDGKNYFEPDITVICDLSKLDDKGCHGAPDWVIEIISEGTASKDYLTKTEKYLKAGVREYWIVDQHRGIVDVYDFEHGAYTSERYPLTQSIVSQVIEGLTIDFADVMKNATM